MHSALSGSMGRIRITDLAPPPLSPLGILLPLPETRAIPTLRHCSTRWRPKTTCGSSPPSADWHPLITSIPEVKATPGERYALTLNPGTLHLSALQKAADTLPEGVRLHPIDGLLYRRSFAADWSRDFVALFRDEADYLARGLGVVALKEGELIAGASSYAVHPEGIEIEIDTRADHRRQGLATACGAALMLRCLARAYARLGCGQPRLPHAGAKARLPIRSCLPGVSPERLMP